MDTIKQIIDKFHLVSKKSLGQNFILDENITDKIVRTSDIKNRIEQRTTIKSGINGPVIRARGNK